MKSHKKNFIKIGIIIPIVIAFIITILFFVVYNGIVKTFVFDEREFALADYSASQVVEIETQSFEGSTISKRDLPVLNSGAIVGTLSVNSQQMPIIYDGDDISKSEKYNMSSKGSLFGENGCVYLSCYKKDSTALKTISKNDIVTISTFYGEYEYKIESLQNVTNASELNKVADEYGNALVIYTDGSNSLGVSDTYFVAVGEMISGKQVKE
jgi:hypothetical protein